MLRATLLFAVLASHSPAFAGDSDTPAVDHDTADNGTAPESALSVLAFAIVIVTIVRPLFARNASDDA